MSASAIQEIHAAAGGLGRRAPPACGGGAPAVSGVSCGRSVVVMGRPPGLTSTGAPSCSVPFPPGSPVAGETGFSAERGIEGDRGVDAGEVSEGLGEVAELLAGRGDLFGV